ncbi:endoribonuclease Dicer [Nematostella vectensis]|uniref:endoribonuclease Dicer n=1 Tax=Nematostella vectensis TaxID=45351 RepID=UPI0020771361|nr:endoribonuclease Dicer [Nematostella vectensis]
MVNMSFRCPSFGVGLVDRSLQRDVSVVCTAEQTSKVFVAFKVIEERLHGDSGYKVFVTSNDTQGIFITGLTQALQSLTPYTLQFCNNTQQWISPRTFDVDIFIGSHLDILKILSHRQPSPLLLVMDNCHAVSEGGSVMKDLVNIARQQPKCIIMGLTSGIVGRRRTCISDVYQLLTTMEVTFGVQAIVSSDLLAVNKYGERPEETLVVASSMTNDIINKNVLECLHEARDTLSFANNGESVDVFNRLSSMLAECEDILIDLGTFSSLKALSFTSREFNKEGKKAIKAKQEDLATTLQICAAKLDEVVNTVKKEFDGSADILLTDVTRRIFQFLTLLDKENSTSPTEQVELRNKNFERVHFKCQNDDISKIEIANHTTRPMQRPVAVILAKSELQAHAINSLISYISDFTHPYLKTRILSNDKINQMINTHMSLDDKEPDPLVGDMTMQGILNGSINVLIVCREVEHLLRLSQCRLVVRFGVPNDYISYVVVKNIAREQNAHVMFIKTKSVQCHEENTFVEFQTLEEIFYVRSSPQPVHHCTSDLKEDSVYTPFGPDGPCVTADTSISLINSFCSQFHTDGLSKAIPHCCSSVFEQGEQIKVTSTLFLPRNSPLSQPFKAHLTVSKHNPKHEPAVAKLRCEQLAALEAVKALHTAGELDSSLQPCARRREHVFKRKDETCPDEIADGSIGRAGSLRRRRAYKCKIPCVFTNSLPDPGQSCYVYAVHLVLTKPDSHERAVRSQGTRLKDPEKRPLSLGIILNKSLPKLPAFIIYDRAGEMTVSLKHCYNTMLTSQQLALIQRFHRYVFTDVLNLEKGESSLNFEPKENKNGCFLVLLRNTDQTTNPDREGQTKNPYEEGQTTNPDRGGQTTNPDEAQENIRKGFDGFPKLSQDVHASGVERCDKIPLDGANGSATVTSNELRRTPCNANGNKYDIRPEMVNEENVPILAKQNTHNTNPSWKIAFGFLYSLEDSVTSFDDPCDPPPPITSDFEVFRDSVVTTAYAPSRLRYYVADIRYDESPTSPFPSPSVAPTFGDYYKDRYGVDLSRDQPLLDVDHVSSRLNFLRPRYKTSKGKDLALPDEKSKRSQRSRVSLVPEMCSIHPIPGSLWRDITNMPSILYRVDALLIAEELRQKLAVEAGIGMPVWPEGHDLPQLSIEEMVAGPIHPAAASSDVTVQCSSFSDPNTAAKTCSVVNTSVPLETRLGSMILSDSTDACTWETRRSHSNKGSETPEVGLNGKRVNSAGTCLTGDVDANVSKDRETQFDPGPSSTLILRALTTTSANDIIDHERLEIYGDAFIKYAISELLYSDFPNVNEGRLSFLRGLRVSNQQLFYLGRSRGLAPLILTKPFEPVGSWVPPGFSSSSMRNVHETLDVSPQHGVNDVLNIDDEDSLDHSEIQDISGNECRGNVEPMLLPPHTFTVISDKTVADTIEALIGACLMSSGTNAALRLMRWLDMDVSSCPDSKLSNPSTESSSEDKARSIYQEPCITNHIPSATELSVTDIKPPLTPSFSGKMDVQLFKRAVQEPLSTPFISKQTDDLLRVRTANDQPPATVCSTAGQGLFENVEPSSTSTVSKQMKEQLSVHAVDEKLFDNAYSTSEHDLSINKQHQTTAVLSEHQLGELALVEASLGYTFRDRDILLQALTHTSYPRAYSSVNSSYEQLEFLGDALLDYLVTRHVLQRFPRLSPGAITDLRSAVVNNYSLACLTIQRDFHKHMRSMSMALFKVVRRFVRRLSEIEEKETRPDQVYSKLLLTTVEDGRGGEAIEVPKVLGDLFEALLGALYVDCGRDEELAWSVIYPLLTPIIEHYSVHLPISPTRQLVEMMPGAATFTCLSQNVIGHHACELVVKGYGRFMGTGRNAQIARSTAAQHALARIKSKQKK